ncbi:MAG: AAA family ATPase, partial [Blastocatellia bacterium]
MMTSTFIQLTGPSGEFIGRLRDGALALINEADQIARDQNVTKRTALSLTLRAYIEDAGYLIKEPELVAATGQLDALRRGERVSVIQVVVSGERENSRSDHLTEDKQGSSMKNIPTSVNINRNQVVSFFEMERQYPSKEAQDWYERLVGLDEHKRQLLIELEILLRPEHIEEWSRKNHGERVLKICELQRNRVPLILLEGDVGTGKTALAETIGDALARRGHGKKHVHLMKINTQIRGTGQVGEMSDLIAQAFAQAEKRARELKGDPVLLLIDEADALAATRDTQQMHHEDKAGLNTVLQRLDNLR